MKTYSTEAGIECTPEMLSTGGLNPDNQITIIPGIKNDGGDW